MHLLMVRDGLSISDEFPRPAVGTGPRNWRVAGRLVWVRGLENVVADDAGIKICRDGRAEVGTAGEVAAGDAMAGGSALEAVEE